MDSYNGHEPGSVGSKTNAQLLKEKHEAAEPHNPTVEEVEDEDIRHGPASSYIANSDNTTRIPAQTAVKKDTVVPKNVANLDTQSEESFPSLGGTPKASAPPAAPPAWAARKASPTSAATVNGVSHQPILAQSSSGVLSTAPPTPPSSSVPTPHTNGAVNNIQPSKKGPMQMAMPGKYTDSITLVPAHMDKSQPIQACLDKLNRKSRATLTRRVARDGSSIVFEGSGPKKDVIEALRTIARELCTKQKLRLAVPASCRAHIIGQGGAVIQDISAKTGAKIRVPKFDLPLSTQDDDDSVTIDVEIEGDPYAVELARLDIDKIVSARTAKVNLRLKEIPPEFFPFLAGPHNRRAQAMSQGKDLQIHIPHFSTWQHRPPPRVLAPSERPDFQPHPGMHVQLSGDRKSAQEVRTQIEQHVEQLRTRLAVEDHSFQRGHHQFIIGERGMSPHDFLEETGCIVVLPPDHDDAEDITIVGPPEHLQAGIDRAATLAAEMQMAHVDPRRYFTDAPFGPDAHSRALSSYLQERQVEEEIKNLYGAQIAFPHQSGPLVNWEIYSRDMKKSIQARSDLTKIVQAHPPAKMTLVEIDPFFHPHLRKKCSPALRTEYGVKMILPRDRMSHHVALVCEGSQDAQSSFTIPRQRPSESETIAFQEAIRLSRKLMSQLIGDDTQVVSCRLEAPKKFQEKLRRYIDREQTQTPQTYPVEVLIGNQRVDLSEVVGASNASLNETDVLLRGLEQAVTDLEAKILKYLEEAEQDEVERGYTTTFEFPAKFNGYLIGREGSKIKELKDQFDVEIKTLEDGKIEIKGPKAKADACKDHINNLRKKFEDEVTYTLKIESKYHGQLVGKKGADVNRLQDKYNVKIQFPHSSTAQDDQLNAEHASDAGGRRFGRPNQAQDEVVIRGPRQGAEKTRNEIMDLYQYVQDNSHSATILVAKQHLGSLIGHRGSEIERLRVETKAQIDFPDKDGSGDLTQQTEIVVRGTRQAVDAAQMEIRKRVKTLDETVTESLEVDRKYHRPLIGYQGSNIRRIVMEAGGPEQSHQVVKFPERGSESTTIRVEGSQGVVKRVTAAVEKFVKEQENQVVDLVKVPPEKHGQLIGHAGESKRKLEQQFNVTLDIPKRGSDRWDVKISGVHEAVSKAKEHLATLADQQKDGKTVEVPERMHHAISANGKLFSQLKNDHGVTVDHGGRKPPPKPKSMGPRPRTDSNATPLITDEATADSHSWVLVPAEDILETNGPSIPWNLTGSSAEQVAAATKRVQRALEVACQPAATGYLTLSDPGYYRFVIGPGGRNINNIREQTGCTIQVPDTRGRRGDAGDDEAIEILGSTQGCKSAKELILDFVKNGAAAARR